MEILEENNLPKQDSPRYLFLNDEITIEQYEELVKDEKPKTIQELIIEDKLKNGVW